MMLVPAFAVAVADDVIVAAALLFLAGAGISLNAIGSSSGDVSTAMVGLLNDYAVYAGVSAINNLIPAGSIWLTNGSLRLAAGAANVFKDFVGWLDTEKGLNSHQSINLGAGYQLADIPLYYVPTKTWVVVGGMEIYLDFDGGGPYYGVIGISESPSSTGVYTKYLVLISETTFPGGTKVIQYVRPDTGRATTASFQSSGKRFSNTGLLCNLAMSVTDYSVDVGYVYSGATNWWQPVPAISSGISYDGMSLDAGVIDNIGTVPDSQQLVISSPVIGAGAADLDQVADLVIDAAIDGPLTAENDVVGEQDVVDPPLYPSESDTYPVEGLASLFPFCIPFDLYDFVTVLAAEPEAPVFTWEADFPEALGGTRNITLDFDTPTWNTLATILRTMELLLFIVGLAFITRQLLRG